MMDSNWQRAIDAAVDFFVPRAVEVRRHLHSYPELSGQELQTSLYLYQLLADQGFHVQIGPEGCGVIADSPSTKAGGCIALRADIDALRIQDRKQVSYCSRHQGVMHACGHDAHSAIVVCALSALQKLQVTSTAPWPISVRGIFQPAEETCTGAKDMIDAGALDEIDAILALHVDPTRDVGTVGLRDGVLTAYCDDMRLKITGRGGHAARPHEASDPIAAAAQLISSMYMFVPRATDSQDAVVLTIGQLTGADTPNAIPELVELRGTLRTLDHEVRSKTIEHIRQLADGIGQASRTTIELSFGVGAPSVVNDSQLTELTDRSAASVLGADNVEKILRPSMGSEDFAFYLEHVPGSMFRLGCSSEEVGDSLLHTPTFDVDENALAVGAKILVQTVVSWFDPHRQSSGHTPGMTPS